MSRRDEESDYRARHQCAQHDASQRSTICPNQSDRREGFLIVFRSLFWHKRSREVVLRQLGHRLANRSAARIVHGRPPFSDVVASPPRAQRPNTSFGCNTLSTTTG